MDIQVMEGEGDESQRRVSNDGDAERIEGGESNNAENSSAQGEEVAIIEPYVGMEFGSEDAAKGFYDEYARRVGFSSKVQHNRSKPDGGTVFREFVCGREGSKRRHADNCDAMLRIELKAPGKWVVTKYVKEHSHSIVSPSKVHYLRPRRHFAGSAKTMADVYEGVGIVPSGIMYVSLDGRAPTETNNHETRSTSPLEANRHAKSAGPLSTPPSESIESVKNARPSSIPPSDSNHRVTNTGAMNPPRESNHTVKNTGPLNAPPVESSHPVKNNGPPNTPLDSNRLVKSTGPSNTPPLDSNRFVKNTGPQNTPPVESNRPSKNTGPLTYVIRPNYKKKTLGRDAQNLLDYFKKMQAENPGFFYAIQLDDDNRMANVFWADARSRTAYSHFGDAVTLDTMYKVYQYKVPFAPFTGINHHGQTILFGCALLLDDSEASFLWLFRTFLTAMNDRQPVSITTDQDKAMKAAVAQVFPQARHCISRWHVLREGQEKLAHVCQAHPNFQIDLYSCINLTETIDEFESSWSSILDKYDLRGHEWLQSIYSSRAQWVPVYFRDSFFAAISPNHGYEGSFFDGYVNQQTTLPMFFRQYERALENWFEREIEADFDTVCTMPVLRTPSPMEKQAASFYTRKIFAKFQEELVETFVYTANRTEGDGAINTFRVAKYEDDSKAYTVTLNYPEMRANCSCQMFEYSGILCRHVLTVFTVTNVLTLPSHYILKRWTRNSKTWAGTDEHNGELHGQESLTMRYNNLCRESIKYAEDGAVAPETYNVAMGALMEGGKKVAVVKKNVAKVAPPSSQVGGTGNDDRKTSTSASDSTPLLWPRQDEMTKRFNLNDVGPLTQPVSDLNLPRMAPVSVHRDDGPSDSMVALPCLKSMTWVMENKNSAPGNRVAVINLKLQDYSKTPSAEFEVKFQLSRVTLEPMLRSMAYISEQLSTPANRVAVINLKLQDTETISGESEVKFQVSRDTLGAMLRSMAYIREQLSIATDPNTDPPQKKLRK